MKSYAIFTGCVTLILLAGCAEVGHLPTVPQQNTRYYAATPKSIIVDGQTSDWETIPAQLVRGRQSLWLGPDMPAEGWQNNNDLSYRWKAAWQGNKIYFLFEVTDEHVMWLPKQKYAHLNDCVRLYIAPNDVEDKRAIENPDATSEIHRHELQFLPCHPFRVFTDKENAKTDNPNTEDFTSTWKGEMAVQAYATGYVMEVAFEIPELTLHPNQTLDLAIAIDDDDGVGLENVMTWPDTTTDFRVTMNDYGSLALNTANRQ